MGTEQGAHSCPSILGPDATRAGTRQRWAVGGVAKVSLLPGQCCSWVTGDLCHGALGSIPCGSMRCPSPAPCPACHGRRKARAQCGRGRFPGSFSPSDPQEAPGQAPCTFQPARLTTRSGAEGKGLARGQAASLRQARPPVPNPGARRIPWHRSGLGPAGTTACSRLPRAAWATANNDQQSTQGSSWAALREPPQAGRALDHGRGRGGRQPALRGPRLGGLAVHCRGSYGSCSGLQGGWRRQPQHHRVV